jgi:hypothetical protein
MAPVKIDRESRMQFEKEREKTLSEIPEHLRLMFGQIGFAPSPVYPDSDDEEGDEKESGSASKKEDHEGDEIESPTEAMLPVLILSPFSVPPHPFRDVYWMEKFSKGKRSKSLKKLSHIVYHYGCTDLDDCYTFVEQDEFVDYDAGVKEGYHELPAYIQKKQEKGIKLSECEQLHIRALAEMNEDIKLAPSKRRRGQMDFLERYEAEAGTAKGDALSLTLVSATGSQKRKRDSSDTGKEGEDDDDADSSDGDESDE